MATREIQAFIGQTFDAPPHQVFFQLDPFIERITDAMPEHDHPALRGLLVEFSVEWTARQHARYHELVTRTAAHECGFQPFAVLSEAWLQRRSPAVRALRTWGERVSAIFVVHHPEVHAFRLRDLIDRDCAVSLPAHIDRLGLRDQETTRLESDFRAAVGLSVRRYLTRRRVDVAVAHLINTDYKIEAIARMVGWRSPKDFYRAVAQQTGRTPAQIRSDAVRRTRIE